jgi:hypothetical protein
VSGTTATPRQAIRLLAGATVVNCSPSPGEVAAISSVIATTLFGSPPWSPEPLTVEVAA